MTNIHNSTADMASEVSALRQDFVRLTATLGEFLHNRSEAAGASVSDAIGSAQDRLVDTASDASLRARAVGNEIEASIERNPMIALLVVFGLGMTFGIISRFRH